MVFNVRSLKKYPSIEKLATDLRVRGIYFALITEKSPYKNIDSSSISSLNYKTYRQGRKSENSKKLTSGGYLVYVHSTFNSEQLTFERLDVFK